jgi:hypothetical protein
MIFGLIFAGLVLVVLLIAAGLRKFIDLLSRP